MLDPKVEELLNQYVLGEMDDSRKAAMEVRIHNEPEFQKRVQEIQDALTTMVYSLPQQEVPPILKSRIFDKIENAEKILPFWKKISLNTSLAAACITLLFTVFWLLTSRSIIRDEADPAYVIKEKTKLKTVRGLELQIEDLKEENELLKQIVTHKDDRVALLSNTLKEANNTLDVYKTEIHGMEQGKAQFDKMVRVARSGGKSFYVLRMASPGAYWNGGSVTLDEINRMLAYIDNSAELNQAAIANKQKVDSPVNILDTHGDDHTFNVGTQGGETYSPDSELTGEASILDIPETESEDDSKEEVQDVTIEDVIHNSSVDGLLMVDEVDNSARVMIRNMPELPEGYYANLWLEDKLTGDVLNLGEVVADRNGIIVQSVKSESVDAVDMRIFVTVESDSEPETNGGSNTETEETLSSASENVIVVTQQSLD